MFGREFQVFGAVQWQARSDKVLWNGTDNGKTVEERRMHPKTRAVMRAAVEKSEKCRCAVELERQHGKLVCDPLSDWHAVVVWSWTSMVSAEQSS